jgi:RNA polymerase sigma factor (TIGR02999 family)
MRRKGMAVGRFSSGRITEQLQAWQRGQDVVASDELLNLVYDELRRQAHLLLSRERGGHTLNTSALVNEAYLKLTKQDNIVWESRSQFFAIAAKLMRQVLIDYARSKQRAKRGGPQEDVPLEQALTIGVSDADFDLLALDEALTRLAEKETQLARVVELRFFCGLEIAETAEALGVSESTVKRDWALARAWLHRELTR